MAQRTGRLRAIATPALALLLLQTFTRPSRADEPHKASAKDQKAEAPDRFSVSAQSETYVQLYRRALLPGQNGQLVPTETAVPVHEYLFANARDVDAPWQKDSIGIEFAAWGRVWPTDSSIERPFDGDVQTASIRLEAGPVWARVGRQQIGGGAARYVRFDGAMVGARSGGFFIEGYGGFTVLPRWNDQPGYHQLGKAEDTLLVYQPATPMRGNYWLTGARLGYQNSAISGSLSFHDEEVKGGVDRRNLGLDVGAQPFSRASLGASALLELDSLRFASARLWVDATPHRLFDLGAEVLHTEPALLLSRQSVLSVFSTDGFEEVGGTLSAKLLRWLRLDTNGYIEAYRGTGPGARGEAAVRFSWNADNPTLVRIGYTRVIAPKNGYQALRFSFSRKLAPKLSSTLEAYGYFYDDPIAGYKTSSMYAGTASYQVTDPLEIMWTASVARSPYAALDAQTMLRATYHFDAATKPRLR
ncbi:MAG TPA: hypothetical protein VFK05_13785 [Polyangiaceae bacterium]|nr:hypothetical protein [Polyangiaceae bacterium]